MGKMRTPVEKHFDRVAGDYDFYKEKNKYYYGNLKMLLKSLIPPGKKIFEIGCATGDLLSVLKPLYGYGMDISGRMVTMAKIKYRKSKNLKFSTAWPKVRFDYIFMSDVIEHLEEPSKTFQEISRLMGPKTIFINTMANPIWEPILLVAEELGMKMPEGPHKRIKNEELRTVLKKNSMKVVKHGYKLLVPVKIPFVTDFANRYLEKYFRKLAFIEYFLAKKK